MIIITGVSRGFGKAIAELYLSKGEKVIGIGRSANIDHENFSFISCDLSDLESVQNLNFDKIANISSSERVILINNAGIVGEINRLSNQEACDVDLVMKVNVSAPTILTQKVYKRIENKDFFTLVNISSGAANRPIPSWASYCASKAALNMITETFYLEELEKGNHPIVYAVSPGVIDTGMQDQIRAANPADFSAIDNFISLKEEGALFSAEEAASRLNTLLSQEFTGEIFVDLREITS